ncbi:MAG: hypothetical protein K1565_10325 [Candidatus Thiodiazotropha sp. (ex. Lucinisca nassula)]|nr:hypothetical protein [Candidatus Thiodiazotropha sp. (ex. Lucinisca nassula)]
MSKKQLALWGSFILLEVVTLLVYSNMWMKDWYYYLLAGLGVISILLAYLIISKQEKYIGLTIFLVVIGIGIGQWWFLEGLLSQASWIFGNGAP